MKTSTNATILAAALAFGTILSVTAADGTGHIQRAAANNVSLAPIGSPKNTALPVFTVAPTVSGKHNAQIQEAYRCFANDARGIDIAHAARPVTAGKDADLDRKWRANAEVTQVAPLK